MSNTGIWYVMQRSLPKPAWVRCPQPQRFCCYCSIRTGASVIGWFNFILNSLYVGMLVFALSHMRTFLNAQFSIPPTFEGAETVSDPNIEGSVSVSDTVGDSVHHAPSEELKIEIRYIREVMIPLMFKSLAIPAIMIIFSVLWLISVEAKTVRLVRLFGKAFILAIVFQLIMQLGFLIYAEIKFRSTTNHGISWVAWFVFACYALLNIYFIPVLSEYVLRRIKESKQGLEQGLLTSEMYPSARVAEAYIEDAFTLESDADVVKFQASLESGNIASEMTSYNGDGDGYHPI